MVASQEMPQELHRAVERFTTRYGLELLFQQRLFKGFYGIASYTLGWTEFQDKNRNFVPSSWDARHIANLTLGKRFKRDWEIGINWRYKVNLTDSQNGFRAIRTDVIRNLDLKENITTIEQEMTMKCLKKGHVVGEVPTHEYAREFGDSTIKLRKVWLRYVTNFLKLMV